MTLARTFLFLAVTATGFAQEATPGDPLATAGPDDIAAGKKVFDSQCALCHGMDGAGGRGPALTRKRLRHASNGAELFDVILNGVPGTGMPAFWFLSMAQLKEVGAYVTSLGGETAPPPHGDAGRGRVLYDAKNCSSCHVINGQGRGFGPELTGISEQRSAKFLRQALLDPGAAVPEGFAMIRAVPRSGAAVSGIRVNEDTFTIQIRDATGRFHSFRKQDLTELQKQFDTSPMPSYRGQLSGADIDDLVAYLMTLKQEEK